MQKLYSEIRDLLMFINLRNNAFVVCQKTQYLECHKRNVSIHNFYMTIIDYTNYRSQRLRWTSNVKRSSDERKKIGASQTGDG